MSKDLTIARSERNVRARGSTQIVNQVELLEVVGLKVTI